MKSLVALWKRALQSTAGGWGPGWSSLGALDLWRMRVLREGNENLCVKQKITGVTVDGRYAEL